MTAEIVAALKMHLTPDERRRVESPGTNSIETYMAMHSRSAVDIVLGGPGGIAAFSQRQGGSLDRGSGALPYHGRERLIDGILGFRDPTKYCSLTADED